MKTIEKAIYILPAICLFLLFGAGCQKTDRQLFEHQTGVYFDMAIYSFSFADHIGETNARIVIPLKVMGRLSNRDRVVTAQLYSDEQRENTANPEYYSILGGVIPAGSETGTFDIELRYGEELDLEIQKFYIKIVPNDDFPDVSFRNRVLQVELSAQEMRPANWTFIGIFMGSTYSTAWWKFIKEATGRTSLPYWGGASSSGNPDPQTWWMEYDEMAQLQTIVRRALREYNLQNPDNPLKHDDGVRAGEEVVMP